ncbi:hypothetical protein [Pseudooceanicola sp.]|jgi:pimeloyl-ACP methyl ester carboxylesterase|uniref:hypothetical protein n=1 Tax=Pseudooceanicola sp. TaxID=1914328 RepID=UPI0040585E26
MTDQATQPRRVATTTAGLRGTKWDPSRLPAGVEMTAHALTTADKAPVTGYLYRRGGETTAVCLMHPREFNVTQYLVPDLLEAGAAVWIQAPRSPGNDIRLEHEGAILDLAAGQVHLRTRLGFEKTVLQGTSGGGPLATFYCQQAARAPEDRIARSPGGKPTKLDQADMPVPDGVILISTHLGQGELLLRCIDPSVIDETDPMQTDASLDPFNPDNGFRPAPESSTYTPEFLERYRAAQADRIRRIDAQAEALLKRKAEARKASRSGGTREDAIMAAWAPIFQVWRTDADPRCFDLSLDPSDRAYGTLWGANQTVSNYGSVGFARVCTPESWLSNWSAFHSNASMETCAPALTQPVLMIEYTGDNSVFPAEADFIFDAIGSQDKERARIHGNHHGRPVDPDKPNGQVIAGETIARWLGDRGFV